MEQKDFVAILRRYLQGEATPSEKNLIEAWYSSLKQQISEQNIPTEAELEDLYRKKIHTQIKRDNARRFFPWLATGIAASVLITISYFFFSSHDDSKQLTTEKSAPSMEWQNIANSTKDKQIIFLPDSSKVVLQPESNLKFSTDFNTKRREVYLEGEASFEVTHNASLPFLVYANEVTTKVLGTSFFIRAVKGEQKITVAVKTGKVSVSTNPNKATESSAEHEVILTPNQQIVYDKTQNEISRTLVEKPRLVLPAEEVRRMRFEEAPVTEIFKALEKAYGVDIEFDEAMFSSCAMTTVISDDDIYSRLDIICNALGTSYTRENDRIVMSSSGCKAKSE